MGCGASAQKSVVEEDSRRGSEGKSTPQTAKRTSNPHKILEPLPILADNAPRLVIAEPLYKLNPVWAEKVMSLDVHELPVQAFQMMSWRRAKYELWEEDEGLMLTLTSRATSDKRKLVSWTGTPATSINVEVLPCVSIEGGKSEKDMKKVNRHAEEDFLDPDEIAEVQVEVIEISEEPKSNPTEIYPFVVRWEVEGRKKCFVIGCEDECSCYKWADYLKLYSNIGRRHCGACMWKLNASANKEGVPIEEQVQEFGNLTNWRRRLCYVDQLRSHKALCITYVSEKSDAEECVANVLASLSGDMVKAVAIVRKLPPIKCQELEKQSFEKVQISVHQYDIAVSRAAQHEHAKVELPTMLFPLEVRQSDDSETGASHNIFAFEDEVMCNRWLQGIEHASIKISKLYAHLPPLCLVQK